LHLTLLKHIALALDSLLRSLQHLPLRSLSCGMKTGLLICDLPAEPVLLKEGDYDKIFKDTFKDLNLVPFQVFKGELPAQDSVREYDAFIITGSSASAYDDVEWIKSFIEFLKKVHFSTEIKVVGICFGFQILAQALGGVVVKNELGWEVGPTSLSNGMMIQSMHQDIVQALPVGWNNLAGSDLCRNQFSIFKKRYFCLQGHPEYTREIVTSITQFRKDIWSLEFYDSVLEKLSTVKVDSKPWIKMIMDFLSSEARVI